MALSKTPELEKTDDPKTRISYDEFLRLYSNGERLEWVNGRVVKMASVTFMHESVRGFLFRVMSEYVAVKNLGIVACEPYNVKLGYNLPGRSPDIMFIAQTNTTRVLDAHLDGAPDLIVEVLSPKTRRIDKVEKFREYQQAGVREYWILDPKRESQEFYVRDGDGVFQREVTDAKGIYHCPTIDGFWIKTEWLWQNPRLTVIQIAREWRLF